MSDTINPNMDGTRNERVAILITSYVIGFITAYIAFGVVQLDKAVQIVEIPSSQVASVITSQKYSSPSATYIAMDNEGLVVIQNNQRTLLSVTDTIDSELSFTDGVHYAISDYKLSPDKTYIYFCEVPSAESDSCRPYTYSVENEEMYPVLVNGERVAFSASDQGVSWSSNNVLIVE